MYILLLIGNFLVSGKLSYRKLLIICRNQHRKAAPMIIIFFILLTQLQPFIEAANATDSALGKTL